ncbi:MAG: sel1 repeat family protein [Clostridia bacterium]|nr:sel1 repeat family protein [Clostridia bacterium]
MQKENTFEYIDTCIKEEDWDSVLDWAKENHNTADIETARKLIECYELCCKQNMPQAFLNLGTFYYNGVFVKQDYKKAFELYKVAADAGEIRAICNCGYCFYYGRHQSVDYAEAFRYFNLGALLYDDANCLYKLGDMFMKGYYADKNERYAYMLYKKACDNLWDDDETLKADLLFRLGKCKLYGIGTEEDIEIAYDYISSALSGFYKRRKTDPFLSGLIKSCKKMLAEIQAQFDKEIVTN